MKNQLKKSFSLFLAVLMVLSCWVWIAPEVEKVKADHTTGQYYIKAVTKVSTWSDKASATLWISNLASNGTGGSSGFYQLKSFGTGTFGSGVSGQTITLYEGYINGFPEKAELRISVAGKWNSWTNFRLDDFQIFVGKDAASCTTAATGTQAWGKNNISSTQTGTLDVYRTAALPYIKSADAMSATTLACPAVGTTNTVSTSAAKPTYWDQYGVKWVASADPTYHISKNENGDDMGTSQDTGFWVTENTSNQGVVNITAKMQENYTPEDDGKNDYYMVAVIKNSAGNEIKVSRKITVSFSKIKFTFNADGSVSGLNSIIKDKDGNNLGKSLYDPEDYYGQKDMAFPTNESVFAEGYTFYGFWTKQQPSSGAAWYYSTEAEFAEPCSSTDYAAYKGMSGATESNGVVTVVVDGVTKRFYDAGEKWDTAVNSFDKTRTYYGWWNSKDVTVKFYDVDGKFLGEKAVKYGQTQADVSWPGSSYSQSKPFVSGAFTYIPVTGQWIGIDGETVSADSYTFKHDLILTPKLTSTFDKTYDIVFVDQNLDANGNKTNIGQLADGNVYTATYDYRETALVPPAREVPEEISTDLQYSYEFLGWSTVAPINGRYHVLIETGNFDLNNTSVGLNKDWIVRNDATYYAVYRRHVRTYAVKFFYRDATGTMVSRDAKIKYGEEFTAPTDYVPYTYATGGYGYTFANWGYTNGNKVTATLGYADEITLNKESINLTLGAVEGAGGSITFQAAYGTGVPTPYTVTFNYRNDKGEVVTETVEVKNGEFILQDTIEALAPAATEYDDGEALVTYLDKWVLTAGSAKKGTGTFALPVTEGSEIATDDLDEISPTSHITFEAVYGHPKPFYTVTYVDGSKTYSERVLVDSALPAWTNKVTNDNGTPDDTADDFEEDVVYVPAMADDAKGSYIFQGWYDEKQTDTTYAATNGNRYGKKGDQQGAAETGITTVNSDVTLYPQFKFQAFTYTILFMDHEGKIKLSDGKFEYGQNIESITAVANSAAQGRPADDTYTYQFIGWDKPVPTVCEGKDITFIAQYKPVYRYYDAKWYDSKLVDGKWTADKATKVVDEKTVETYLLATTHHTYNSKVYAPSVATACREAAPTGQTYVFAGWYYNDAEGNAHKYERGMLITGAMEFYATYSLSQKPVTVTTVVGTTETTITVDYGSKASDVISTPQAGYVNATKHNAFDGWFTEAAYTNAYTVTETTTITADIKIYAKFTESDHVFSNKQLKTAPTYYEEGVNEVWCSCNPAKTKKDEEIAILTDTVAPTGTIYLGTLGSWSSTGAPAYNTDGNPVELYANADTDIIITVNDTGDVNTLYNPSGIGKGVKTIKVFAYPGETALTADGYGAATDVAITIHEDTSTNLNNTANFTAKLGDVVVADLTEDGKAQYDDEGNVKYKELESGKVYIIYYFVYDKNDNLLNRLVRTAKFVYDDTDPEFTVEGVGNDNVYCEDATVVVNEEGVTVTVNGDAVTLTAVVDNKGTEDDVTDDVTTYEYTISEADNYLIVATDKAGNSTQKKIKVTAHEYDKREVKATCTTGGYKEEKCIICGHEKDRVTYPATGHILKPEVVSATCTENGYIVNKCTECDYSVTVTHVIEWLTADEIAADAAAYEKVIENGAEITKIADEETYYLVYVLENGEKQLLDPALGHEYPTKEDWVTEADGEYEYVLDDNDQKVTETRTEGEGEEAVSVTYYKVIVTAYTEVTAATCVAEGKEESKCKYCDHTIERAITVNPEAHDWSEIKTLAPTCTDAGKEYQVCNRTACNVPEKVVKVLPATGHTPTEEWVITAEATCGKDGLKTLIKKCSVCKVELVEYETDWVDVEDGEYEYVLGAEDAKITKTEGEGDAAVTYYQIYKLDENGDKIPVYTTEVIPATGRHILEVKHTDWVTEADGAYKYATDENGDKITKTEDGVTYYQILKTYDATATEKGMITHYCTQCGTEWSKETDTIKRYTVKFVDEDGEKVLYTISDVLSGTTITEGYKWSVTIENEDDTTTTTEYTLTDPTKANSADGRTKYTFAGWTDASGKTVAFPFDVTADITLTAKYTASTILYTHQFKVPNVWTSTLSTDEDNYYMYAELMGAKGDVREPASKPVFKLTDLEDDAELKKLYTIEFDYWANAKGEKITDFTIAGDATFYAVFKSTPIKYTVTYYNGTTFVWQTEVEAGSTVTFGGTTPTKTYDSEHHYVFDRWYADASLVTPFDAATKITANTRVYADFTAIDHVYDKSEGKGKVTQEATCTLPEITTYTCNACANTTTAMTKEALGHNMGEYVYDDATGNNVSKCTRCDYTHSVKASVTVKFVDENGITLQILTNVKLNSEVTFDFKNYGTPTKDATTEKKYTFAGWVDADNNKYAGDYKFTASTDATYTAYFSEEIRTYTVSYVDINKGDIAVETYTLKYNEEVPAFTGDTSKLKVPAFTTYVHYEFANWSVAAGTKVTGDIIITPVFEAKDHVMGDGVVTDATCTEKGGLEKKCTANCGYSYKDYDAAQPAKGHSWNDGEITLKPDYSTQTDGVKTYTCTVCGETKNEPISGKSRSIKVTVKDDNGVAIEHAEVRLLKDGEIINVQTTDNTGVTIFTGLDNGNYSIYVVDTNRAYNDIVVNEDGSVKNGDILSEPEKVVEDTSCKCSCHKNNFWGIIFRLFQKIIKLFAGKPSCCSCPDGRIG